VSSFQQKKVPARNVEEVDAMGSPVLLDVRETDEWEAGHAPDAWFWPLARLDQVRAELPHGTTIVCVCRSGARSAKATDLLLSWGLDAVNLEGGMKAWAAAGKPVVQDDGSPGTII
jgi:rhodanese-related sulfurtransferase